MKYIRHVLCVRKFVWDKIKHRLLFVTAEKIKQQKHDPFVKENCSHKMERQCIRNNVRIVTKHKKTHGTRTQNFFF